MSRQSTESKTLLKMTLLEGQIVEIDKMITKFEHMRDNLKNKRYT